MADDLYHEDLYAWSRDQAEALRARKSGQNSLDYDNLAEEIEDLGGNIRRACISQVENILLHFLLIQFVGGADVAHWKSEIVNFRIELEKDLTPSLRKSVPNEVGVAYGRALKRARAKVGLEAYAQAYPERSPYEWDQIAPDTDWAPEPRQAED